MKRLSMFHPNNKFDIDRWIHLVYPRMRNLLFMLKVLDGVRFVQLDAHMVFSVSILRLNEDEYYHLQCIFSQIKKF
jgi:hypothetical protein